MSDYEYLEYGNITEEFSEYMAGFYDDECGLDYHIDMEYCA